MAGVQRALLLVHVMAAVAQLVLVTSRQLLQLAIGHQRMAIGQGQMAIGAAQGPVDAVDSVDAADRGVSRHLVDGMAVVAVVLDRGARAARAAQRGGNRWNLEIMIVSEAAGGRRLDMSDDVILIYIYLSLSQKSLSDQCMVVLVFM